MSLLIQSLNGWWEYRIGTGPYQPKLVPYAALPVGQSDCRLVFDRLGHGTEVKRAFLRLEGITYAAKVTLNGQELGQMLAYSRYEYEVTDILLDVGNVLDVEIRDIDVVFGPSEGWENYSGIIRDVLIIYTGESKIDDIFWQTKWTESTNQARCLVNTALDLKDADLMLDVTLWDKNQQLIYNCRAGAAQRTNFI